jgi:hypothetical protein
MKRRVWITSLLLLPAAIGIAGPARSQSSSGEAVAETLYREGRKLMGDARYAEACAKFAESQRLDPASGTLLNLAACHDAEHLFATAWLEYTESIALARRDQREDRVRYAEERMRMLEPKLSHLGIVVSPESDVPELQVEVDGVPVRNAARGVPIPVDPGSHRVDARAPGHQSWSQVVKFDETPSNLTVTIPVLPSSPSPTTTASVSPTQPTPGRERPSRPIPTAVYLAGGATVGAAVGATVTGIWYLNKKSDYDATRSDADYNAAKTAQIVNLGFWIATALGATATGYFYFARPAEEEPTRGAQAASGFGVAPSWNGSAAGLNVWGNW